jgi:hypothetical protein
MIASLPRICARGPAVRLALTAAFAALAASTFAAENTNSMYKPQTAVPGGLDPRPAITRSVKVTNAEAATVEWFGFQAPFDLQAKPTIDDTNWTTVLTTNGRSATLPLTGSAGFLRVKGADVNYAGAETCKLCHSAAHTKWNATAHAKAFDSLKNINQHTNTYCLKCHVVGLGQKNGFKDEATTPQFKGVQCENCHGPGGAHAGNPMDKSVRPVVTIAAEVCGGCHTDAHHPTFDEWSESRHAVMDVHVAEGFITSGQPRMQQCGGCHSGAVRLAMLKQIADPAEPFPSREDAAYFSIECTVCHNAHDNTLSAQLRNPVYSTNFFSYNTSTNLAVQYDANLQLCGQCHNQRGALWTGTGRPPHHSPQYNMLVGQIVKPGTTDAAWNGTMSPHGKTPLQCTQCHTHPHEVADPDEEHPNYTGHTFEPQLQGCVATGCHTSTNVAEILITGAQTETKAAIQEVKGLLDTWATTKAAQGLRDKYGKLAWEFTSAGQLSNPTADPAIVGPTTAEQSAVPNEIKKARFLLYMVEHDASYGIHNGDYSRFLLQEAKNLVNAAP